jgi:hypothetical protein
MITLTNCRKCEHFVKEKDKIVICSFYKRHNCAIPVMMIPRVGGWGSMCPKESQAARDNQLKKAGILE